MKLTRNKVLVTIAIAGLLIVTGLAPDTQPPPKFTPPPISTPTGAVEFPVPPARPRDAGSNPFDQPFLFELAGTDKLSGSERENVLAQAYARVLESLGSDMPDVEVEALSGLTVVTIDGELFATVLPADCPSYYDRLSDDLKKQVEHQVAEQWRDLLIEDLADEVQMRSPDYRAGYPYLVVGLFFFCLLLHAAADAFAVRFLHSPGWTFKLLIWLVWLSLVFVTNPDLKPLAMALARGGLLPVFLGTCIVALATIVHHLSCAMLEFYVRVYKKSQQGGARLEQRLTTMTQGARFLIATVATVGGLVSFLIALKIPLGSFFAGAGLAGVAIGVVGKDILIDYFYGINILLEDQFSIGDFIEADAATGIVESFNLRTTRVREPDGGLSIVANGMFRCLTGTSAAYSLVIF